MPSDVFHAADWLSVQNNRGAGKLPIPSQLDLKISALIAAWLRLDQSSREAELSRIPESYRFTLLSYSERMASFAVRDGDREHIFLGLLALGLDGWKYDWRDNAVLLSLHYDAARRINVLPDSVFEDAALLLPREPAVAIRSFLRRSEEDKSLRAMGYEAGADGDGFRYKRTW